MNRGGLLKTRFYWLASQFPGFGSGNKPEQQQSRQDHEHAEETDLPFFEFQDLLKQTAPAVWRHHGHQPLQDEHQAHREQEGFEQGLLSGWRVARRATHSFEKLGTARIEHHHVALAVEAGFVSLKDAIKLRKLGVATK